ncbi:MAG: outer membrane protein assembly factor, partial [Bacteroidia bacterium]|nr:outer membrane protein assembly factor [Bacteroidia bacterium]
MRCVVALVLIGWAQDTLFLDPRKRLHYYELLHKRPGWVILGYPVVGYDALRGIGAALTVSVAHNGKRTDPLFAYQPYKHYFFLQVGFFVRDSRYMRFLYDAPWINQKPYRINLRLNYRTESQGQFWGIGEQYLKVFLPRSIQKYEKQLKAPILSPRGEWETHVARHYFYQEQWQFWIIGERVEKGGLFRLLGGIRGVREKVTSLAGRTYTLYEPGGSKIQATQQATLLDSAKEGLIFSPPLVYYTIGNWQTRVFAGGAWIWDSRDFEISSNSGWVIEVGHESQIPSFQVHKSYFSFRYFHTFYHSANGKVAFVGAFHGLISAVYGSCLPFLELYTYSRWSEGRIINLLTGPSTVRAFRENRFVVPFSYLFQYEIRSRVAELNIFRQHLTGGPIFFVDIATGTDHFFNIPKGVIYGVGIGGRVLWNMTTVLRADIAYGKEG